VRRNYDEAPKWRRPSENAAARLVPIAVTTSDFAKFCNDAYRVFDDDGITANVIEGEAH
jgi:hypothetical protein